MVPAFLFKHRKHQFGICTGLLYNDLFLPGHNILQHYRRLHSDSSDSSSSKDSLSGASSGETSSMSISVIPDPETEVSREPEVKQDMTTDHMVDRNCHANGSYAYINGTLPEEELTRTKRHCPLCISEYISKHVIPN